MRMGLRGLLCSVLMVLTRIRDGGGLFGKGISGSFVMFPLEPVNLFWLGSFSDDPGNFSDDSGDAGNKSVVGAF